MHADPFHISLDTLLGVAPMLGHALEDRRDIRDRQDSTLAQAVQARTNVKLRDATQQDLFCVAPYDILVTQREGRKEFHIIEMNGTGIGGLTNMTPATIGSIMDSCREMAQHLEPTDALVLVASSGKEDDAKPKVNRLLHEKILYVEALRRGFERSGRPARIVTINEILKNRNLLQLKEPIIALGYMKELLSNLRCGNAGQLTLFDRQVHAAINDRFCLNILHHFDGQVDFGTFKAMNRCFLAGGDKGIFYELLNDYLKLHPHSCLGPPMRFERVADRERLIETIHSWIKKGRKTVIKPQGTGRGHGIEFFLNAREEVDTIAVRVDRSIKQIEQFYGVRAGAFPYTVCEFVDTLTIPHKQHPLHGHKYELRVPVYRDGMKLKGFPSIVKISSESYDGADPSHLSLINNITASSHAKEQAGINFMLPLANRSTWEMLDLRMDEVAELCAAVAGFTRFVLDQTQDRPEFFQLTRKPS